MKAAKSAKSVKSEVKKNTPIAHAVGRRKKAVARVWMKRGSGGILVNNRPFDQYFDTETVQIEAALPMNLIPMAKNYDMEVTVEGGGQHGQAGAVKLGIARALLAFDESNRTLLREHDLLTVDDRRKERKKYGQKGARRKFQFVKR